MARDQAKAQVNLKAEEVMILDLTGVSDPFDAIILAPGTSEPHRRALAEAAWVEHRNLSESVAGHREGTNGGWILLDCGDVIVHIMSPELRDYYELEEFWGDAPRTEVNDTNPEEKG